MSNILGMKIIFLSCISAIITTILVTVLGVLFPGFSCHKIMAISRTDLFVDSGYSNCIAIVRKISEITALILQTAVVLSNLLFLCLKKRWLARTYDFIK